MLNMLRLLGFLTLVSVATVAPAQERPPSAGGQVTFLYFNDLAKANQFYGDVLGLELDWELEWVKIYKVSPTSFVGLVNATEGSIRPSEDKPVMVSLVVERDEIDAWYSYLKSKGVEVGDAPGPEGDGAVRGFNFKDPEGYTIEFFAWVNK